VPIPLPLPKQPDRSSVLTKKPVRLACGLAGVALLLATHLFVWKLNNPVVELPDINLPTAGIAYNGYSRWNDPEDRLPPTDALIAGDLKQLAAVTRRIRSYSSTEMPGLLGHAQSQGLAVSLGAWLDSDPVRNQQEITAAIFAAQTHSHVDRLILGNETQLTQRLPAKDLYRILDEARKRVRTPVSTAEPWHVWLSQPEIAQHVDFITVHLLPYWEGIPAESAVDYALDRLAEVQARFPKMPIVIGEVGWPSQGASQGVAKASPQHQAAFVREFVHRATTLGLDYYLMEAIDQPWKRLQEGKAGGHWGLWDVSRSPKFSWAGPIAPDRHSSMVALGAGLIGLALALPVIFGLRRMRLPARIVLLIGTQVIGYAFVWFVFWPFSDYLRLPELLMALGLIAAITVIGLLLLSQLFEFSELFWPGSLRTDPPIPVEENRANLPKVSLHLACSNEPPEMVIQAIKALLALDWPALEIIVVDNNTHNPKLVTPVHTFVCSQADPRLQFYSLARLPGFKAGALNFALEKSDPQAAWIGVVDADYAVHQDWIRSLAGYFYQEDIGLIQAPQAHRDSLRKIFSRMAYWEYEGFFRLGMHHRNQRNAIIQHGTMTLIRAQTLRTLGGWNPNCLCEDSELGLRILATGARAVYTDQVYGTGLLPEDFIAYRSQRHRWAHGAMQILQSQAAVLTGRSPLTLAQRYHFFAGWLPWLGDALHLVLTLGAIGWSLGTIIAPHFFPLPTPVLLVPLLALIFFRLASALALYRQRVGCSWRNSLGASLAGMGLSHVIARGIFSGLFQRNTPFAITRKQQNDLPAMDEDLTETERIAPAPKGLLERHLRAVHEEVLLVLGLVIALGLFWGIPQPAVTPMENRLAWSVVLVLQALPYLAAIGCAIVSAVGRARFHDPVQAPIKTGHRAHWASPEGTRSGLTSDVMTPDPPPPG
jgi:exo-beta-1,3-glucanase (GH17 family)/cellulose synthase/poly-beta-1,6-N-acetylglucosamine synthase-like glycosyltransferase